MERQYIGARYVPKFADPIEWDNQRSFEALTVVNYMGASYTSKKAVPAGVKPTDANYWAVTGNYNAQVEQYRQETVRMGEDIEGLINNVKQLEGKKIMIIGDSLSDPDVMAPNWVTLLKNKVAEYGVNATINTDFCVNGESYSGIGQANRLAAFDNYTNEWDIIVIALGVNDYQGQFGIGGYNDTTVVSSTAGYNGYCFTAGMNNLLSKLRTKFPKAIQYGIIPHRTGHIISGMKIPIAMYRYAIGTMLQYYGARIIDLSSMPMYAPLAIGDSFGGYTSASDKLHPSNVYAPILCNYILQNINSGGANNWKLSGNKVRVPVLSESVGAEGQFIGVTYYSDGRIMVDAAITCNVDVTGKSYITFTDEVNYLLADIGVVYFPCNVNANKLTVCGTIGKKFFVTIPPDVTTLNSIFIRFTGGTNFPMHYWEGIVD